MGAIEQGLAIINKNGIADNKTETQSNKTRLNEAKQIFLGDLTDVFASGTPSGDSSAKTTIVSYTGSGYLNYVSAIGINRANSRTVYCEIKIDTVSIGTFTIATTDDAEGVSQLTLPFENLHFATSLEITAWLNTSITATTIAKIYAGYRSE